MTAKTSLWPDLGRIWQTMREVDVGTLRAEATHTPQLAFVGTDKPVSLLQGALQRGPCSLGQPITAAPVYRPPLENGTLLALASYDLRILVLDKPAEQQRRDLLALAAQPAQLLAVLDAPRSISLASFALEGGTGSSPQPLPPLLVCPLDDDPAVAQVLWPALVAALPNRELALARSYPALRPLVSRRLIQDTALTNATYAFSTGIGDLVPPLAIPLTAADMVILTKNQVLLGYKLSLVMGETESLRQVLPKLASVVGAGFIWRQLAREMVGLIPAWGLVPKVAVAYAGTYASGQAVYQWYMTGEKLQEQDLRALFRDALAHGRALAEDLLAKTSAQGQAARERLRLPAPSKGWHLPRLRGRR